MSLALSGRRNDYAGNGTTTAFAYEWRLLDESYVKVVVKDPSGDETILTLDVDYTVGSTLSQTGDNIDLIDDGQDWIDESGGGLKDGWTISLIGVTPLTQITDIRNQGSYYPSLHEDAFDKLTMIAQEQQKKIDGCIRLPDSVDPDDFDMELPDLTNGDNAGKIICINDVANGVELKTAEELAAAVGGITLDGLGVSPWLDAEPFHFTNNMAATDVTGETYSSTAQRCVSYEIFVVRGTLIAKMTFIVGFNGTAFLLKGLNIDGDDIGLTPTITGTTTYQLQIASTDATNGGTIYVKKHLYPAT